MRRDRSDPNAPVPDEDLFHGEALSSGDSGLVDRPGFSDESELSDESGFSAWSRSFEQPRFSDWLRAGVASRWQAAVTHRFVEELFTGSVARDVLRRYLVQDYQFVDRFVALLGAAVASADTTEARMTLARQLGVVGGSENTYFHRAFDALEVPQQQRENPEQHSATAAFNELMTHVRSTLDYPRCLAVLGVAEWLYRDWARRAPAGSPDDFVCREWIELHSGQDFEDWVSWLREELDRVGPRLSESAQHECRAVFARATELELDFFEAAYDSS